LAQTTTAGHEISGLGGVGAGQVPASGRQAFLVQIQAPVSEHAQVLHPSSEGLVSPGLQARQALSVQAHDPFRHEQVLQPSPAGMVSPELQPVHAFSVHAHPPVSVQVHVLQPSPAAFVSPGVQLRQPSSVQAHDPSA
jgi:hypothetical protein